MFSMREFRDLDLMAKLRDEGPVAAKELAGLLGNDEYGRHLGSRLGWMRHYGMLDRDPKTGLWSLTEGGARVLQANSRAIFANIDSIPEEQLVGVMADVTARYRRGDAMIATMLRREFSFGTQRSPS